MMQEMGCDPISRSVLITDGDSPIGRSLVRALTAAGAGKIWIGAADDGFGTDLDIVINTCDAPPEVASAETEMRINYFSLLQLTQDIAPVLERRAAAGRLCAWVNLLSIDALSNAPPRSTYAASKAAAHSFTQHLRRRLQASGIRVLGVYPEPGYAPDALAGDIVNALKDGIEDVFAGPIARAWADGVRDSPKVLEREIAR